MSKVSLDREDWTEAIDKHIVRTNYNLGLGFKDGYIFFRVSRREFFPLLYDPFAEITGFAGASAVDMSAAQYITAKELPSTTLSSTNILKVDKENHIYQIFYGVSPDMTRIFTAYPRETEINQLDEGLHNPSYTIYGFIDGFESPLSLPSPRSQIFIPKGPLVAFAFYNPTPYNIKPLLRFAINRLQVDVITNQELVQKIIDRRVECTFAPVGGLDNPWGTNKETYKQNWGVQPVNLLASPAEIAKALTGATK
jgi:hypothetical protein